MAAGPAAAAALTRPQDPLGLPDPRPGSAQPGIRGPRAQPQGTRDASGPAPQGPVYPRGRRGLTGFLTGTPGARMSTPGRCRPDTSRCTTSPGTASAGPARPAGPGSPAGPGPPAGPAAVRRTRPGAGPSRLPAPKPPSGTPASPRRPVLATSTRRISTTSAASTVSRTGTREPASTRGAEARRSSEPGQYAGDGEYEDECRRQVRPRLRRRRRRRLRRPGRSSRQARRGSRDAGTAAAAGGAAAPGAGSAGSRRWPRCWSSSSRWRSAASMPTAST